MLWWVVLSVYISPLYFLKYCRRLNVSCGNFRTPQPRKSYSTEVKGITMSAYSTYFSLLFISKFTFTNYCPNVRKILYLYIDMGFKWMGLLSVCLPLVMLSVLFSIVNMGLFILHCGRYDETDGCMVRMRTNINNKYCMKYNVCHLLECSSLKGCHWANATVCSENVRQSPRQFFKDFICMNLIGIFAFAKNFLTHIQYSKENQFCKIVDWN